MRFGNDIQQTFRHMTSLYPIRSSVELKDSLSAELQVRDWKSMMPTPSLSQHKTNLHAGEGQLMTWDEHVMLIAHTVNRFGDKICVIGNTGSNSTGEAVRATCQVSTNLRLSKGVFLP